MKKNKYIFITIFIILSAFLYSTSKFTSEYSALDLYNMKGVLLVSISILLGIVTFFIFYKNKNDNKEDKVTNGECKYWQYIAVLIVLSGIILCLNLDATPNFNNDEHLVVESAFGFMNTGKFVSWDFFNRIPTFEYSRAWPHSFLLAFVFKMFGASVFTGRMLSVVFGIFCIISCFYIFERITKNKNKAFVASLIVLFNPQMIEIFRTVRMYAIAIPISVWLLYFGFRAITNENKFKNRIKQNKVISFIEASLNFNVKYIAIALALCIPVYIIMPNSLFISIGFVLFIFHKKFIEKDQRFALLSKICYFSIFIIVISIIGYFINPNLFYFIRPLVFHIGFLAQPNFIYFFTNIMIPFGLIVGIILIVVVIMKCYTKDKGDYDFQILCVYIWLSSTLLFTFNADRYYQYRYMAYLLPVTAFLFSEGLSIVYSATKKNCTRIINFVVIFSCMLCLYSSRNILYGNSHIRSNFEIAYPIIKADANNEGLVKVPFYSYQNRYYYTQILGDVDYLEMDSYKNAVKYANDERYEIKGFVDEIVPLIPFAKINNTGYISFETEKFNFKSPILHDFLMNCTNKITGDGLDESNVQTFKYYWYSPSIRQDLTDYLDNGGKLYDESKMTLNLNEITNANVQLYVNYTSSDINNYSFVSITLLTWDEKSNSNKKTNYILEMPDKEGEYEYSLKLQNSSSVVELSNQIHYYTKDNTLQLLNLDIEK